jgi:hypothetical protein
VEIHEVRAELAAGEWPGKGFGLGFGLGFGFSKR